MINNVTLMGRLTAAPELKQTTSGTSVAAFCIAVERRYRQKDGGQQTDFINCVAWRNTAEFITKYFNRGDMIAVTGEIQTRQYQDKSGNNRVAVEVVINNASFCGGKNGGGNTDSAPQYNPYTDASNGFADISDNDDLPF